MNKDFLELTRKVIAREGVDPAIGYLIEEEKAKSPYVVFNKINVFESFLSYVWCNCYSFIVLYHEIIVKKSFNDFYGVEEKKIDMDLARGAYQVWEYAMTLICQYSEWGIDLPNPERVPPNQEGLVSKVNALYLNAMTFYLAHEFAHIELRHNSSTVDTEKAADERAMNLTLEGADKDSYDTKRFGILMGLCSLLFFKSTTKSSTYPDMDDRIDTILQKINPGPQDGMWGIATLAYKLWDRLHCIGLEWREGMASPMELYYDVKRQVKERTTSESEI